MVTGETTFSSARYWENRYRADGTSGAGSRGRLAEYKADFLNTFFLENRVSSVIEFGCGEGYQLGLLSPQRYTGIDVSPTAIDLCRQVFSHKRKWKFFVSGEKKRLGKFDLTLSLDVIFHLVEDSVFSSYCDALFKHSQRFVIIYSSNFDAPWPDQHVRHRNVVNWLSSHGKEGWKLSCVIPNKYPYDSSDVHNTSFCDFLVYTKAGEACVVNCP
jgi:SAM-dependent methyltransferase